MSEREVRLQEIPDRMLRGRWIYTTRPLVRLGDVGRWSMVRNADFPQAAPFVISRKEWDKLTPFPHTGEGE